MHHKYGLNTQALVYRLLMGKTHSQPGQGRPGILIRNCAGSRTRVRIPNPSGLKILTQVHFRSEPTFTPTTECTLTWIDRNKDLRLLFQLVATHRCT